ncbi:MAG: hypothetical protein LBM67_00075 [Lentimicrobiaceae bacterium]|nr:hypothetical protein [Lentimicrobiaceae bacterium]
MNNHILSTQETQNLLLEKLKMGWWIKDDSRQIVQFSESSQKLIGLEKESISYDDFVLMIRDDYRDRILKEFKPLKPGSEIEQLYPLNTRLGEVWVRVKMFAHKDTDNPLLSGFIQVVDSPEVTTPDTAIQLRTNNLLFQLNRISKILLSFLQEKNPDAVINSTLRDILKQFKAGRAYIFEYDFERSLQTNTFEVVDDKIKPEIDFLFELPLNMNSWWTNVIKDGQSIILSTLDDLPKEAASEKEFLDFQDIKSLFVVPLFSHDGVWGYGGIDLVEEFHTWTNEDGEWITAMFNIVSLCIQLQRSEKKALLDKAHLENLYKHMPLGYIRLTTVLDENEKLIDYIIRDANHAAEELFQEPLSQFIGTVISAFPVMLKKDLEYIDRALKNNSHLEDEYYIEKTEKHTRLTIYSIKKNELICLFSDITESYHINQKLIEAKEKAELSDRLKTAFLANMSHEIRTPLNSIVGFSTLLAETDNVEERKLYYKIVHENNDLLLQLISDILDISKMESGTLDIFQNDVNVNQLCREIVQSYRFKMADTEVKLIFDEQLPPYVILSDKNRLTQIISNFINNALKFTIKGSITLGYSLNEQKNKINFFVKDTGKGIAKEDQKAIFDRFVKLDNFAVGTGLGLSICKNLVTQMGGEIGVESEVGKGSCFWFSHPYSEKD